MTSVEEKLRYFVGLLMDMDKKYVVRGRENNFQEDYETDYVVVDDLAPSERISGSLDFDGDAEVQTISNNYITTFTIDFYGTNAYDKSNEFVLMARSQKAYELKKVLGIGVYQVSSIQDLKKLTGQQYGNRYQVTLKVEDSRAVEVDTLRIDEAQIETITD